MLGPRLLRVKGLVATVELPDRPLVIQGAQHVFHPPRRLPAWPDGSRETRLVVISDGLEMADVEGLWRALVGIPEIEMAATAADGPGTAATRIPAAIAALTRRYPGSEIAGVPASVISATFSPRASRSISAGVRCCSLCSK